MALNFLEAWRAEIPWKRPAQSGDPGAQARQLQQEAEDLIETWMTWCGKTWETDDLLGDFWTRIGMFWGVEYVEHGATYVDVAGDKALFFWRGWMLFLSIPKWRILAILAEV